MMETPTSPLSAGSVTATAVCSSTTVYYTSAIIALNDTTPPMATVYLSRLRA
jgi:hypothetical protein